MMIEGDFCWVDVIDMQDNFVNSPPFCYFFWVHLYITNINKLAKLLFCILNSKHINLLSTSWNLKLAIINSILNKM